MLLNRQNLQEIPPTESLLCGVDRREGRNISVQFSPANHRVIPATEEVAAAGLCTGQI